MDDPIARRLGTAPVSVPRAAELVVQDLRRRIAGGELAEGSELPVGADLARRYGVSPPTLREAMRVLASESLLELPTRNTGARVRAPSAAVAARHVTMLLAGRGATLDDVHLVRELFAPAAAAAPGNRTLALTGALLEAVLDQQGEQDGDRPVADLLPGAGRLVSAGRDATGLTGDVERVASSLRARIVGGELPAGSRLPAEAELMREFEVSRVSLRSAVRMLESDGLLVVRRGARGGLEVTRPGLTQAARYLGMLVRSAGVTLGDYVHARRLTSPQVAARTVGRLDDAGTARLVAVVAAEDAALAADDLTALARSTFEFYRLAAGLAGSVSLELVSELLDRLVMDRSLAVMRAAPDRRVLVRRHRAWVTRAAMGDDAGATELWRQLTEIVITRMLETYGPDVPLGVD